MFESQCQATHEKLMSGACPWCGRVIVYGQALPPEWTSESRRSRFEFHGGFMDGQVVGGEASVKDESTPLLWRYLYLTNGGRIGTRFDEVPNDVLQAEIRSTLDAIKKALDANDDRTARELFKEYRRVRFGHTYEVTQREERPDEILIRLDVVDDDTPPPAADKPTD